MTSRIEGDPIRGQAASLTEADAVSRQYHMHVIEALVRERNDLQDAIAAYFSGVYPMGNVSDRRAAIQAFRDAANAALGRAGIA